MKKLFTLLFVAVIALSASAQRANIGTTPVNQPHFTADMNSRSITDTLVPQGIGDASLACTLSLYNSTGGGYVGGNNGYGDLQKCQMFDPANYWVGGVTGNVQVTEVLVWFGGKKQGGNSNVSVKIMDGDETFGPGTVLGTSSPVNMSLVDTGLNIILTSFPFTTPVSVASKFFAAVVLPTGADTVGIVSTTSPCSGGAGWSWDQFADLSYLAINDAQNWGLDIDLSVFAVVNHDNGVGVFNTNEVSINPVSPNPANTDVNLNYALRTNSNVTISVVDVTGKIVKTHDLGKNNSGVYNQTINVTDLANGIYSIVLNTNTTKAITKLVVAH